MTCIYLHVYIYMYSLLAVKSRVAVPDQGDTDRRPQILFTIQIKIMYLLLGMH